MREEDSERRDRYQKDTEELIQNLRSSPQYEEKIRMQIDQMFMHPLFDHYIAQVWHDLKDRLLLDATSGNSKIVMQLDQLIRSFSLALIADTISRKFELYVGKDLQYIRINGTIVGGLVGLALHFVSLML